MIDDEEAWSMLCDLLFCDRDLWKGFTNRYTIMCSISDRKKILYDRSGFFTVASLTDQLNESNDYVWSDVIKQCISC